mmetsp:Transcript_41790/g.97303  ORF Transcript_41790/g.97303 Transcript_41790/m.97303 type:complete len:204 (-) Transcript_41790:498-1109(-)
MQQLCCDLRVSLHPVLVFHLRPLPAAVQVQGAQGAHVLDLQLFPQLTQRVLRVVCAGGWLVPHLLDVAEVAQARPQLLLLSVLEGFEFAVCPLVEELLLTVEPLLARLICLPSILRHTLVAVSNHRLPLVGHSHGRINAKVLRASCLRPLCWQPLLLLPKLQLFQLRLHIQLQTQAARPTEAPGVHHRLSLLGLCIHDHGHAH